MAWKKIQWSDDAAAVTVRKNSGSNIGTRPRLNFVEGSNITLAISDDAGGDEIDISIAASGGVTDHGALTGLADYDHDQYLRRNGGNTVTGNLLPDATASYRDLGSAAQKWDDVYAQDVRADRVYMAGTLNMAGFLIDNVDDLQADSFLGISHRDSSGSVKAITATTTYAFVAYANVDMNASYKIINLANPTLNQDAATKYYVDNTVGYTHPSARQCTTGNWAWASITGKPSTYSPSAHENSHESGGSDVIEFDSLADGSTYKKFLNTERTKLSGIETGADVTDATNVNAAGAVMLSDASIAFDTINEKTSGVGVTVDGVKLKDGAVSSLGVGVPTEITISSTGQITPTQSNHLVDTYGNAATDNLDNIITTSTQEGDLLFLSTANATRDVTVRDNSIGGGNISLEGNTSLVMSGTMHQLVLMLRNIPAVGLRWCELMRFNG